MSIKNLGDVEIPFSEQPVLTMEARILTLEEAVNKLAARLADLELAAFSNYKICPRCKGRGEVGPSIFPRDWEEVNSGRWTGRDDCPLCRGWGKVTVDKEA